MYQLTKEIWIYQILDKSFSEMNKDPPEGKAYYATKPYEKLPVKFVLKDWIYNQYTVAFYSQSIMHKYKKAGYISFWKALAETDTSSSPARRILRSITRLFTPNLCLTFRN